MYRQTVATSKAPRLDETRLNGTTWALTEITHEKAIIGRAAQMLADTIDSLSWKSPFSLTSKRSSPFDTCRTRCDFHLHLYFVLIVWLRFVNHLLNYYLLTYLLTYVMVSVTRACVTVSLGVARPVPTCTARAGPLFVCLAAAEPRQRRRLGWAGQQLSVGGRMGWAERRIPSTAA